MPNNPFDDLARELPDGAFWPTGEWFKRVFATLTADRVRAGSNLDELPTDKGRFFNAKAEGDASPSAPNPPFTVVDASAEDSAGNPHPGHVRVYNGRLFDRLPKEMNVPDGILADGTDNRCYLVMMPGLNYIYGKVLMDATKGIFTVANVYVVDSEEDPDGTYLYRLIATVTYTAASGSSGASLDIEQEETRNWSPGWLTSADGTMLQAVGDE